MKKLYIFSICSLFIVALIIDQYRGDESSDEYYKDTESVTTGQPQYSEHDSSSDETTEITEDSSVVADDNMHENVEDSNSSSVSLELPAPISSKPEQILIRAGYTTSYNNMTKNANWVAWHLTRDHTDGPYSRGGTSYMVDYDVEGGRQELSDWKDHDLPIDHGHLCPAGDCKWSKEAMRQSFLLTNMCPQNSDLNRGDWEELESRCRGWARHYGDIYIAAGPIFYNSDYETIGSGEVGVPDAFFKVVLYYGKKPKALGFIYPNNGESHKIQHYVTTVDDVEEKTGIDFFHNLPDDIEARVESVADINKW